MKEINGQVPVYSLFQGNIIYQISLQKQRYRDIGWFTIDASIKIKCFFEYFLRYITYYVHKNMRLLVDISSNLHL